MQTEKQLKNLKPLSERSTKEAREIQSLAGKKSGEAKRKKKALRDYINDILKEKVTIGGVKMSKIEGLIRSAVNDIGKNPDIKDLKILFELAGLYSEKEAAAVNVNTFGGVVFKTDNPEVARMVTELAELGRGTSNSVVTGDEDGGDDR